MAGAKGPGRFRLHADPDRPCHGAQNPPAMADTSNPLLWTYKPPPQHRTAKPTEPIWTVRKDEKRVDARLLSHGEYGWEVQLYADGGFYAGRRFHLRAEAIAYSDVLRRDIERDGWTVRR